MQLPYLREAVRLHDDPAVLPAQVGRHLAVGVQGGQVGGVLDVGAQPQLPGRLLRGEVGWGWIERGMPLRAGTRLERCSKVAKGRTWQVVIATNASTESHQGASPHKAPPSHDPAASLRQHARTFAMSRWSPVIILTSTPNASARSMVCRVSGRGGSRKVSRPTRRQGPGGGRADGGGANGHN